MLSSDDSDIEWDSGTAYDLFASLIVLHEPERHGLRGSWAAGVRSRLPLAERECLQRVVGALRPMRWVYTLPAPKDASTTLAALRQMEPRARLAALVPDTPKGVARVLRGVAARGAWNDEDVNRLIGPMQSGDWQGRPAAAVRKSAIDMLTAWSDVAGSADGLLSALEYYYAVFFAEEEARIRPMLTDALARAQHLATSLPRPLLLEELSQGLRLSPDRDKDALVLAPCFWLTPFALVVRLENEKTLFLFGARPADVSLVPGEFVPDALHQGLKALAEPTRLRILHYLNDEPLVPAELARRLRLRPPTVIHHLDALRLARLVNVTLDSGEKRYTARPGGAAAIFELLNEFLAGEED